MSQRMEEENLRWVGEQDFTSLEWTKQLADKPVGFLVHSLVLYLEPPNAPHIASSIGTGMLVFG